MKFVKRLGIIFGLAIVFTVALQLISPAKSAHAEINCDIDVTADSQWNSGGFHYINWKIATVAHSQNDKNTTYTWMDSRECDFGNVVSGGTKSNGDWVIDPSAKMAWVTAAGAISPTGVSFGLPSGHTHLGCGDAAQSPFILARPPVFKYSNCREAAIVDDGGAFQINGTTLFCQGLPGVNLGGWANCGYYPGQLAYPDNGAAGNMFTKFNCLPFTDGNPPVNVDCNSTDYDNGTFSWYKRAGSFFAGGGGLTDGDGLDALFLKKGDGTLDKFTMHAVAFNTQVGNFATVAYLTMKYPITSVATTVLASTDNVNFYSYNNVNSPLTIQEGSNLWIRYISLNATTCSETLSNGATTMLPYTVNSTLTRSKKTDTTYTVAKNNPPYMSYKLNCINAFDSDSDIAYIKVTPAPSYPWLQVKFGDVMAFGKIFGQKLNTAANVAPGGRLNTAANREAMYVIISALNTGLASYNQQLSAVDTSTSTSQFCSTNSLQFGKRSSTDATQTSCTSGAYVPNVDREFLFPKAYTTRPGGPFGGNTYSDMVINNFWKGYDDSNRSAAEVSGTCETNSAGRPYAIGGNPPTHLSTDMRATGAPNCPTVWARSGGNQINGGTSTIQYGRATVFYDGDLFINNNIQYTYTGTYTRINDVPNLGIIVKGNVYIDKDVTQIDAAIYSTGAIVTCTQYIFGDRAECRDNRLTVNGALLARGGFYLGRQVYSASNTSAASELIQTNGQFLSYPPPGFDNRYGYNVNRVASPGREFAPSFGF